jgi:hypothetical protein
MEKQVVIVGNVPMGVELPDNVQVIEDVEGARELDPFIFDDYKEQYVKLIDEQYADLGDFSPPIPKRFRHLKALPVRDSKTNPKQGRNDLCLCESGKKYKNCCIKI